MNDERATRKWWHNFLLGWRRVGCQVWKDFGIYCMYTCVALPAEWHPFDTFQRNWYEIGWVYSAHCRREARIAEERKLAGLRDKTRHQETPTTSTG